MKGVEDKGEVVVKAVVVGEGGVSRCFVTDCERQICNISPVPSGEMKDHLDSP